jgi:hypothetical protein
MSKKSNRKLVEEQRTEKPIATWGNEMRTKRPVSEWEREKPKCEQYKPKCEHEVGE